MGHRVYHIESRLRRRDDLRRAVLMHAIDPRRHRTAEALVRLMHESGARAGAVRWAPVSDPEAWWFTLLQLGDPGSSGVSHLIGQDREHVWGVALDDLGREPELGSLAHLFGRASLALTPSTAVSAGDTLTERAAEALLALAGSGWFLRDDFRRTGAWLLEHDARSHPDDDASSAVLAMAGAIDAGDLRAVADLAVGLGERLEAVSQHRVAGRLYEAAYEACLPEALWDLGLLAARRVGRASRRAGDFDAAERWYRHAYRLASFDQDMLSSALILDGLANAFMDRGSTPRAREVLKQARVLAAVSGDAWAIASAQHTSAYAARVSGDLAAAQVHQWEALQHYADPSWKARALMALGLILLESGSVACAQLAYSIARRDLDGSTRTLCTDALAYTYALQGNRSAYAELWSEVEAELADMTPRDAAQVYLYRARSLAALGRRAAARRAHRAAIRYARKHGLLQFSEKAELDLEQLPETPIRSDYTERIEEWLRAEAAV